MRTYHIGDSTMFTLVAMVTVMLLVCGPHVTEAGFEFGAYCRKLCQWGKGGNLCKCSAVHFAGKRNNAGSDDANFALMSPSEEDETDLYSKMLNKLNAESSAKALSGKVLSDAGDYGRPYGDLLDERALTSELDRQSEERFLTTILKLVGRQGSERESNTQQGRS